MKTQNSEVKAQNYRLKLKNILIFLSAFFFLAILSKPVSAASITLSNGSPSTISDVNQEHRVEMSLSIDASDGTVYYLRGIFYKSGTNNYCGFTWNGSSWFNGPFTTNEGWKNLLPVSVSSSSAVTVLKAKLDINDSGCKDSGIYNFKVQRYTQGGSSSIDQQNVQSITVNIPTPTPSPTSVPTSTPNPSNTPVPSNTPGPTTAPTASAVPTKKPTVTIKPREIYEVFDEKDKPTGVVLGESAPSETPAAQKVQKINTPSSKMSLPILFILIGGGAVCIIAAVLLSIKQTKERKSGLF